MILISQACSNSSFYIRTRQETQPFEKINLPKKNPASPTRVLFLIDGLSIPTLKLALQRKKIPNLARFFSLSSRKAKIKKAKTVFSSSTYPSIISLLTMSKVSQHNVIGNRFLENGYSSKEIVLEDIFNRNYVDKYLGKNSVFFRLEQMNQTSISLSVPFQYGSSISYEPKFEDGINYINHNYSAIDSSFIQTLENILRKPKTNWPNFLFIHLIGVDALSHDYGHLSEQTLEYLEKLDTMLAPSLARLKKTEVLLTADHGFTSTPNYFQAKTIIPSPVKAIIESRVAHLYFPPNWSAPKRNRWIQKISKIKAIGIAAIIDPQSKNISLYQRATPALAPENIFLPALRDYFQAQTRADAVLIANANFKFLPDGKSQHGGMLSSEFYVPLLARNLIIPEQPLIFENSKLLELLFYESPLFLTKNAIHENSNSNTHHIR